MTPIQHNNTLPAAGIPTSQAVSIVTAIATKQILGLEALLKVAPPVRDIILTGLSNNDLDAFEIALGKGTTLHTDAFQAVKKQITQKRNELLLKEILTDHPEWKSQVEAWKNVSIEDKIWLLQLSELQGLRISIPGLFGFCATPKLLEPRVKKLIIEALAEVTDVPWQGKNLKKCPRAIGLLVNLKILNLLKNELTLPPDISRNVKLEKLYLNDNQLTVPPDVSRNFNLQNLSLQNNRLTVPPDVSRNVNLVNFDLSNNKLTVAPDVRQNGALELLDLSNNQLTTPPDVSQNVNLEILTLGNNQLTTSPDINQNENLQSLDLTNNPLTEEAKKALTQLEDERGNLGIDF